MRLVNWWAVDLLVSRGHSFPGAVTAPQTWWLKTTEVYSLTGTKAGCLKSVLRSESEVYAGPHCSLPLPASGGCWNFLTCGYISSASASVLWVWGKSPSASCEDTGDADSFSWWGFLWWEPDSLTFFSPLGLAMSEVFLFMGQFLQWESSDLLLPSCHVLGTEGREEACTFK